MGQVINNSYSNSGLYQPTVTSLQGNTVNADTNWIYVRTNNICQIIGLTEIAIDVSAGDQINITVPFGTFNNVALVYGVYSLGNPHTVITTPNNLTNCVFGADAITNTAYFGFTMVGPVSGFTISLMLNFYYVIE